MRWATRSDCHVDRVACAWLIGRFVDSDASFVFVDDADDIPADAVAFDIRGAQLSHHDGKCSFETFLAYYDLDEPALAAVGRLVHEADLGDDLYDAPEAPGVDAIVRGLAATRSDVELVAAAEPIFDALYALNGGDGGRTDGRPASFG